MVGTDVRRISPPSVFKSVAKVLVDLRQVLPRSSARINMGRSPMGFEVHVHCRKGQKSHEQLGGMSSDVLILSARENATDVSDKSKSSP